MVLIPQKQHYTPEEYLELEEQSKDKIARKYFAAKFSGDRHSPSRNL